MSLFDELGRLLYVTLGLLLSLHLTALVAFGILQLRQAVGEQGSPGRCNQAQGEANTDVKNSGTGCEPSALRSEIPPAGHSDFNGAILRQLVIDPLNQPGFRHRVENSLTPSLVSDHCFECPGIQSLVLPRARIEQVENIEEVVFHRGEFAGTTVARKLAKALNLDPTTLPLDTAKAGA